LGDSEDEIFDNLKFIHNGLNPVQSKPNIPDSEVEDSGIGDTIIYPKGKKDIPNALTRPLDDFEKQAASIFPGGEIEYRKRLAKMGR